ncbi:DUF3119 family protein [Spirulina sp. CS-785/01]|uniref:DUF3119 family protein n=1 Tax=Spirulina sp. CS-785/01 TaxID=3021716 RepID=UPI00232FB430|nr:DUF3119 family protein [Spirulina sp. CS-785/01]MDB9314622.1 DUF3119 family protein [Spirulina sp. CS-785/01]
MTTTNSSATGGTQSTELKPSYGLPLVLILGSLPLIFWQRWVGGAIALFGLFLLVQAATIRLHFTETALEVYRSGTLIRHFPYQDWSNWRIFWNNVPVLFYFREVNSIHFLPVLFDPETLKTCLAPLPRKD